MRWIAGLYLVNTVMMLFVAIREVRRPANALNWLVIGLIVPVIGFGLYLIASNPVRIQRGRLTSPRNESDPLPDSFSRTASVIAHALRHLAVQGLRSGQGQVLTNGTETYARLLESIRNAQTTIEMEYYIFRDDHIGSRLTDLLIERAGAGVRIRFLIDGWGSRQFPQRQLMRMMDAGIECRTIFPLRFPWILSGLTHRDHCKIVVIDGKEAFTGGINIGDEYTGLKPKVGFWRDTHLRVAGEAAADLLAIFQAHWSIASPERMTKGASRSNLEENTLSPAHDQVYSPQKPALSGNLALSGSTELAAELGMPDATDDGTIVGRTGMQDVLVHTFEGNPGISTQIIREVIFICLTQAAQTIDITNPYFVPDADIIMALKTAVARGVRVRLLVPRHVIPKIVGNASRTYYGELIEAGVHIYLYDKGILHAKLMVIDEEIAEIGSANYDLRSYRLNYEVCQVLYSADVARGLTEQFERDLMDSVPLSMDDLQRRSRSQRMIDQAARLLSPLL